MIQFTLGSTRSPQYSGLFDHILPLFQGATGVIVRVVAVGTGQALAIAKQGKVSALLVHDRIGEDKFIADGYGLNRCDVMYNDFVIVGPASDPAHIRGLKDAQKALSQIAAVGATFVSRGDDGGTHRKELRLWQSAGIWPVSGASWYRASEQDIGSTLDMAAAVHAYTLTDRATWANFNNRQDLQILTECDVALFSLYSSILVNPAKWPCVKFPVARIWHEWLTSKRGVEAITSYCINGQQQFFAPNSTVQRLLSERRMCRRGRRTFSCS